MPKKKSAKKTTANDRELVEAAAQKAGGFSQLARALGLHFTTVFRWRGGGKEAIRLSSSRRMQLQHYLEGAHAANSPLTSSAEPDASRNQESLKSTIQDRLALWALDRGTVAPSEYHRIKRTSERDVSFAGWLVGEGKFGYPGETERKWERGRNVHIYVTASGRLVVAIEKWSQRPGEGILNTAAVFMAPEEVLKFLLTEGQGKLMHASKTAWEEACKNCAPLTNSETEFID